MLERVVYYAGAALPPALVLWAGLGAGVKGVRGLGAPVPMRFGVAFLVIWLVYFLRGFLFGPAGELAGSLLAVGTSALAVPLWLVGTIASVVRKRSAGDVRQSR